MLMGRQSPATQTAKALVRFSQTGVVIFLEKSWSAASVMAKFSWTNATYNFSFVDCSVNLPFKQKLSAPQSLSSLQLQLPSWSHLTAGTWRFRVIPHFEQGGLFKPH